jgi:hypothetical protein
MIADDFWRICKKHLRILHGIIEKESSTFITNNKIETQSTAFTNQKI